MHSLAKRIADLEKAQPSKDAVTTIIVRFLSPENLDGEIQELQDSKGLQQWKRQPAEAEQALIDRATSEVTRNGALCTMLMQTG